MTVRGDQNDKANNGFRWAVELLGDAFDLSVAHQPFQYGDNIRIKMVDLPNDRTSTMLMAKEFEEWPELLRLTRQANQLSTF
jgi:hypothetical protein